VVVPHVEVGHEHQEWGVDRRDVVGEPVRQIDVGDRAGVGAVPFRELGERASKTVAGKHQGFADDNRGSG